MFPLVHIYCTKRIVGDASPLLLFGSIFPDIEATGVFSYGTINDNVVGFSNFIKDNHPDLRDFAEGLLFHEEPKGVDRFVHGENGYAFVKGRIIVPFVERHFPKGALEKSHNYVELAVQVLLVEEHPEIQDELQRVLESSRRVSSKIAEALSGFFGVGLEKSRESIKIQDELLSTMDFSSVEKAVDWYVGLSNRLRNANYSKDVITAILEKAVEAVQDDYEDFIEKVIAECKISVR
ncbi:MAG: hypothetical protein ABH834_00940 [Candidatus Altiarchaeota archaeon]